MRKGKQKVDEGRHRVGKNRGGNWIVAGQTVLKVPSL